MPARPLTQAVKNLLHRAGFDLVRVDPRTYSDFEPEDLRTIEAVTPFTRTGPERLHALIEAVKYVARDGIPGAIVECGVWRGGSMMAAARTLIALHAAERDLYLFDTFEGMPDPSQLDLDWSGLPASRRMASEARDNATSVWCLAALEDVQKAMGSTGYDPSRVRFVKGLVEDTLPSSAPESIALLRLDTDWYESTRHELIHLFPRLVSGGVLILDDYGHWQGARKALDEYFEEHGVKMLLNRIDYSARIGVKL
jgi:hypothetical protein